MAGPKTAAQLQAEADAKAREEQEQEARLQQRGGNPFDFLGNLFGGGGDGGGFNLFSLIMPLLMMTGIYFLAKTDFGQGIIQSITNMLPEDWRANILGGLNAIGIDMDLSGVLAAMDNATVRKKLGENNVPEPIIDIIAKDDATFKDFLDVVKTANGGKVTFTGLTSEKTIAALILKKPAMASALARAALSLPSDGKPNATAEKITHALHSIVNGTQLDTLLASENRANIVTVLMAALPAGTPLSEKSLSDIIAKGIDPTTGRARDGLRALFNDAIDGHKDALLADANQFLSTADQISVVDASKLPAGVSRYTIATLQQNPKAQAALDALLKEIGPQESSNLLALLSTQGPNMGKAVASTLLKPENAHTLPQALALLDQLPELTKLLPRDQATQLTQLKQLLANPAHQQAVIAMASNGADVIGLATTFMPNGKALSAEQSMDALLDANVRANLHKAGTAPIATLVGDSNHFLSAKNIDAALKFGDAIGNNADNTKDWGRTKAVIHALSRMATGNPAGEALKGLNSGQLAAFFSIPGNRAAVGALIKGIDTATLNPEQRREIAILRVDFDKGNGIGLGYIFADQKADQFLLTHLPGKISMPLADNSMVQDMAMQWMSDGSPTLAAKDNRDILIALGKSLGTTSGGPSATPPARPGTNHARS